MPTLDFGPETTTRTMEPSVQPIIRPRRTTVRPELRRKQGPNFFQILEALKSGKLPSNDQLISQLKTFKHSGKIQSKVRDMSTEGQQLWGDVQQLVDTLCSILEEKNDDEMLQHMMYHSRLAAQAQAMEALRQVGPGAAQEAERTARATKKSAMSAFHVLRLVISNEEIRDLIGDVNDVLQQVFKGFEVAGLGHEAFRAEKEHEEYDQPPRRRRREPETRTSPTPAKKVSRERLEPSQEKKQLETFEGAPQAVGGWEEEQVVPGLGPEEEDEETQRLARWKSKLKEPILEEEQTQPGIRLAPISEGGREDEEEYELAEQFGEEAEQEPTRVSIPTTDGEHGAPHTHLGESSTAATTTSVSVEPSKFSISEPIVTSTSLSQQGESSQRVHGSQFSQETADVARHRGGANPSTERYWIAEPSGQVSGREEGGEQQHESPGIISPQQEHAGIQRKPAGKYAYEEKEEVGKEPSPFARPGIQRRSTQTGGIMSSSGRPEPEKKEKEAWEKQKMAPEGEEEEEEYLPEEEMEKYGFEAEGEVGTEAETATTTTTYSDIALTTEHREEIVKNLMDIFRRMHEEPELRAIMGRVFKRARTSMDKVAGRHRGLASGPVDANAVQATKDLQRLLERFAQNTPLAELRKSIKTLRNRMIEDPRLCEIVENGLFWLERCAGNPYYRDSEEAIFRGSMVIRELRFHMHSFYRDETATFAQETNNFIRNARFDPLSVELLNRLRAITDDVYDVSLSGDSQMKTPLMRDFLMVMGPAIWDQISVFHIPRVEYVDPQWTVIMDEFDLNMKYFIPENLYMNVGHELMMGLRDNQDSDYARKVVIKLEDIRPEAVNVPFSYSRKSSFFPMEDRGIADIGLSGKTGFTITTHLEIYPEDVETTIYPTKIQVDMGNVVVNVREAKYSKLYKYGGTFLNERIRNQLIRTIQDEILQVIEWIDEQVTRIKVRQLETEAGYTGRELLMHNLDMFFNGLGMNDMSSMLPGKRSRSKRYSKQFEHGYGEEPTDMNDWRESGWQSPTTTTTTTTIPERGLPIQKIKRKDGEELDIRPLSQRRQTMPLPSSNMPWSSSLFDMTKKFMSR